MINRIVWLKKRKTKDYEYNWGQVHRHSQLVKVSDRTNQKGFIIKVMDSPIASRPDFVE